MSSSTISVDEVRRVAKLARIKLSPTEEELFTKQLGPVVDYFEVLNKIDTSQVKPSFQITELKNVFREDQVLKSFSQSKAISTAPKTSNGFIVTKASIDK